MIIAKRYDSILYHYYLLPNCIPRNSLDNLAKLKKKLTVHHIPLSVLENLSIETKKFFDESIKSLIRKRKLFKKLSVRRDYLKLWQHHNKQIVLPVNWRYLLSAPFIYGMVVPAVIWHLGLEIYHQICFRFYGIPLVKASEYFILDRQLLSYLNLWEKINCYYCSYVNNLIRYSSEIGGRTERYWCPIKYARHLDRTHSQYPKFLDKNDKKSFRQDWDKLRKFSEISSSK